MIHLVWAKWGLGALAAYAGYEVFVKKEKHPFGAGTPAGVVRKKAVALIQASTNPAQLRQLATGLHRSGDPQAAQAAADKATAIERAQAPFAAAVSYVPAALAPVAAAAAQAAQQGGIPDPSTMPLLKAEAPHAHPTETLRWQMFLKKLYPDFDYSSGPGTFGPHTRDATKRFQSAQALPADGQVGPMTWTRGLTMGA